MKRILFVTALTVLLALQAMAQGAFVFPSEVKPLLHTSWGQEHPYNKLCPWEQVDTIVRHSPAGCGPLVMAQVMRRYSYPQRSRLIGTAYDWADMPAAATDSTPTGQQDAVAQLIVDCGTAAGTVYTQSASATKINGVVAGLKKYFGYSRYMHITDKADYAGAEGLQEWKRLMFGELKAGRPVVIRAERNSHDAHVFIIDGCRDSAVHVNWGWGGKLNGYYDPDTLGGYRLNQRMVVDVAPEPPGHAHRHAAPTRHTGRPHRPRRQAHTEAPEGGGGNQRGRHTPDEDTRRRWAERPQGRRAGHHRPEPGRDTDHARLGLLRLRQPNLRCPAAHAARDKPLRLRLVPQPQPD